MSDPKDIIGADVAAEGDAAAEELEAAAQQPEGEGIVAETVDGLALDDDPEAVEAAELAEAAVDVADDAELADGETASVEEAEAVEAIGGTEEAPAEAEEDAEEAPEESVPAASAPAPKKGSGIGDLIAVGILSLIMGIAMVYLAGLASPSGADGGSDLTGGIAATVDGVAIGENDVTVYVAQVRKQQQVEDDDAWGEWLVGNGLTPETLRTAVINQLVSRKLVEKAIEEEGVSAPAEEVENYIAQVIEQEGGEEAFAKILSEQGMTMDEVRQNVELAYAEQALAEKIAGDVEVTDEEILEMMKLYYPDIVGEDAKTLDGVDESMVDSFRENLKQQKIGEAYSAWMSERQSNAKIEVVDMPEGLPYAIDITSYEAAAQDATVALDGDMDDSEDADGVAVEVVDEDEAASEEASK